MTVDEIIKMLEEDEAVSSTIEKHIIGNLLGWSTYAWAPLLRNGITTSLDAARLLFRIAFPGWLYRVAECCISDDAWVAPDFQHPQHGKQLQEFYPEECQRDPVEWFGADVDQRPPGRPAQAFCLSMMIAHKKVLEWRAERESSTSTAVMQ